MHRLLLPLCVALFAGCASSSQGPRSEVPKAGIHRAIHEGDAADVRELSAERQVVGPTIHTELHVISNPDPLARALAGTLHLPDSTRVRLLSALIDIRAPWAPFHTEMLGRYGSSEMLEVFLRRGGSLDARGNHAGWACTLPSIAATAYVESGNPMNRGFFNALFRDLRLPDSFALCQGTGRNEGKRSRPAYSEYLGWLAYQYPSQAERAQELTTDLMRIAMRRSGTVAANQRAEDFADGYQKAEDARRRAAAEAEEERRFYEEFERERRMAAQRRGGGEPVMQGMPGVDHLGELLSALHQARAYLEVRNQPPPAPYVPPVRTTSDADTDDDTEPAPPPKKEESGLNCLGDPIGSAADKRATVCPN